LRIGGHDSARTFGNSGTYQISNHPLCKLQKPLFAFSCITVRFQSKKQGIVLVGVQGLFLAALTAESQPAVWNRGFAKALVFHFPFNQFKNSDGQPVVEFGYQCDQLFDRPPLAQHHFKNAVDFVAQPHERVQRGGASDFIDNLERRAAGFHLQIVFADDTDHVVAFDHHQQADTMAAHGQQGFKGIRFWRDNLHRLAHNPGHGHFRAETGRQHPGAQIVVGHYAQRVETVSGNHNGADTALGHHSGG